jgi:AcrR family transcriptional regulator
MPKISQEQKNAVRTDILHAAREVFMRKGYEATTMKDIVEESGRSFGGVYMYFSNKDELFHELLRIQYAAMAGDFHAEEPLGAWEAVERFLHGQQRRAEAADAGLAACMYEYFIVGRKDERRRVMIEERHGAVRASIEGLLQRGIASGEFRPSQPVEDIVHFLISFLDGVFLESMITGHARIRIVQQFELLHAALRHILFPSLEGR